MTFFRSPNKQVPKQHIETKTDYGKYSRNNSTAQDYTRTSHQDLTQSHLSIHQMPTHHHSPMKNTMHSNGFDNGQMVNMQTNGQNTYKPIPPPKPKNYKPPYNKGQPAYGPTDGIMQPPLPYQHGKSHSNPVVNINLTE